MKGSIKWYSLPANVLLCNCESSFKRHLKNFFLQVVSIACYAEPCISYDQVARPPVCPSVCLSPSL